MTDHDLLAAELDGMTHDPEGCDVQQERAASHEWSDRLGLCWYVVGVLCIIGGIGWTWRAVAAW